MIDHDKIVEGLRALRAEVEAGTLKRQDVPERVAELDASANQWGARGDGATPLAADAAAEAARARFDRRVAWVLGGEGEPG